MCLVVGCVGVGGGLVMWGGGGCGGGVGTHAFISDREVSTRASYLFDLGSSHASRNLNPRVFFR